MALSTQQHLDLVDAVIVKRLNGDSYESYTEQQQGFRGTPLDKLYDIRRNLQQQLNGENGGCFGLVEPFGDGNSRGPVGLV